VRREEMGKENTVCIRENLNSGANGVSKELNQDP
jgi:hypothetical protein